MLKKRSSAILVMGAALALPIIAMVAYAKWNHSRNTLISRLTILYSNMKSDPYLRDQRPALPARFLEQNKEIVERYGKVESFQVQSLGLALDTHTWSATILVHRHHGNTTESVVGWPQPRTLLVQAHE